MSQHLHLMTNHTAVWPALHKCIIRHLACKLYTIAYAKMRETGAQTYLTGVGTPQVYTRAQTHAQHVRWWPVYEIQIKIVLQVWSIQNLERDLRYFTYRLRSKSCTVSFVFVSAELYRNIFALQHTLRGDRNSFWLLVPMGDTEYGDKSQAPCLHLEGERY